MTDPLSIWMHAVHNETYRCGGWAWMRGVGRDLTGAAGGERGITAPRLELTGLQRAVSGLPAERSLIIHVSAPRLRLLPRLLAGDAGDAAPEEDLDLWAAVAAAIGKRPARVLSTPPSPRTPMAFIAAWAELGADKAKQGGAFSAPIPKPNFAKVAALVGA